MSVELVLQCLHCHISTLGKWHTHTLAVVMIDVFDASGSDCVADRHGSVLSKVRCPSKFVIIIRSFHGGMTVSVFDSGPVSSEFSVSCGTKQACVLAPFPISIFFSTVLQLHVASKHCAVGVPLALRTDHASCLTYANCSRKHIQQLMHLLLHNYN